MAKQKPSLLKVHLPIQGYGLAVVSVGVALGIGLLLQRYSFHGVESLLFLFAIALTVWFGGSGPAVLAVALSSLAFNYFLTEPLYSLYVTTSELPYYFAFILFAILLTWFSAVRRRVERELLQSRDELRREVAERTQQAKEIRNLNAELGNRTTELEATNKELEAFAYSVSHDLRAPIRHVVGYAELLQRNAASALDETSHRYMMTILESAKRMGTLIDDLLAFSRIGRAETRATAVNLDLLVKEALGEVQQDTNGRNIAWQVSALPDLYGDRPMLRLALVNLISNAVKFTRTRPRAQIEIGCLEKNEEEVVVFIRDNGVGFDMKYVDKLFGVFRRLHSTQAFEGTGIGLATVQRIIHRHGGRVWAEGLVDRGATFFLAFPATGAKDYGHIGTHLDGRGRPQRRGAHPDGLGGLQPDQ
jgi:signal transduction histidine kinase